MSKWKPKADSTICKCGGILWNITSRLAQGMGILHLKCDKCKKVWALKVIK
jgi:hypothetical protein